ncbi:hypothetical protein HUJ05_012485 [Dendroctonus ponderosae]|nr:hypothetical protein HUJ05_012485 [Dendroctonus ponderosae]
MVCSEARLFLENGPEFLKVPQHSPSNENSHNNQQSLVPQRNLNSAPQSPEKRDESSNHDSIGNDFSSFSQHLPESVLQF